MSYEPTNWKTGDVVTSAKLNKLENGVANSGGVMFVNADENNRLDKTWQEINDAITAKTLVCISMYYNGRNNTCYPVASANTATVDGVVKYWIETITDGGMMIVESSTHSPDAYLDVWTPRS